MRISDWSSDVCSSDLGGGHPFRRVRAGVPAGRTTSRSTLFSVAHPGEGGTTSIGHYRPDRDAPPAQRGGGKRHARPAGGAVRGHGRVGGDLCAARGPVDGPDRKPQAPGGRQSGGSGKRVSVRLDCGGSLISKKKK